MVQCSMMKLTEDVIRSFMVAKAFKDNTDKINCIDFSSSGEHLVTSSDDDSMNVYDCLEGKPKRTLYSKKYGCTNIKFTHHSNCVVHSSNKLDDTIRYLSLHDNKYIRYFSGHTKKVVSISMSPVDDSLMSGSLDKTIRLWDLRSPNCQGLLQVNGRPVCSFDPEGLIFAAAINTTELKLYDVRSFDKGPFANFYLPKPSGNLDLTDLRFSPDGKLMILPNTTGSVQVVDAYHGTPLAILDNPDTRGSTVSLEATFTPDSMYVLCGSGDGRVHAWMADSGRKVGVLTSTHPGPTHCLKFNPRFLMMASGCTSLGFWIPNNDLLDKGSDSATF